MGGINVGRWLAGGVVAGILIWLVEGAGSVLYMSEMETALEALGKKMDMGAGMMAMGALMSLVLGLTLVFFYAAARPRFGAGPRTAVVVAAAVWFGSTLLSLLGYAMLDLFPRGLLVTWGVVGFVELILASLAGGWVYRE
jgi:hypothetical protein